MLPQFQLSRVVLPLPVSINLDQLRFVLLEEYVSENISQGGTSVFQKTSLYNGEYLLFLLDTSRLCIAPRLSAPSSSAWMKNQKRQFPTGFCSSRHRLTRFHASLERSCSDSIFLPLFAEKSEMCVERLRRTHFDVEQNFGAILPNHCRVISPNGQYRRNVSFIRELSVS